MWNDIAHVWVAPAPGFKHWKGDGELSTDMHVTVALFLIVAVIWPVLSSSSPCDIIVIPTMTWYYKPKQTPFLLNRVCQFSFLTATENRLYRVEKTETIQAAEFPLRTGVWHSLYSHPASQLSPPAFHLYLLFSICATKAKTISVGLLLLLLFQGRWG